MKFIFALSILLASCCSQAEGDMQQSSGPASDPTVADNDPESQYAEWVKLEEAVEGLEKEIAASELPPEMVERLSGSAKSVYDREMSCHTKPLSEAREKQKKMREAWSREMASGLEVWKEEQRKIKAEKEREVQAEIDAEHEVWKAREQYRRIRTIPSDSNRLEWYYRQLNQIDSNVGFSRQALEQFESLSQEEFEKLSVRAQKKYHEEKDCARKRLDDLLTSRKVIERLLTKEELAGFDEWKRRESEGDAKNLEAQLKAKNSEEQLDKEAMAELYGAVMTTSEYTVKSGDTLGAIAYGNGCTISKLKKLNNLRGDSLAVGQKLKVPARGTVGLAHVSVIEPAKCILVSTSEPADSDTTTYIVQEGENLMRIARDFDVTPEVIRELNNLGKNDEVKVGQVLKIPPEVRQ